MIISSPYQIAKMSHGLTFPSRKREAAVSQRSHFNHKARAENFLGHIKSKARKIKAEAAYEIQAEKVRAEEQIVAVRSQLEAEIHADAKAQCTDMIEVPWNGGGDVGVADSFDDIEGIGGEEGSLAGRNMALQEHTRDLPQEATMEYNAQNGLLFPSSNMMVPKVGGEEASKLVGAGYETTSEPLEPIQDLTPPRCDKNSNLVTTLIHPQSFLDKHYEYVSKMRQGLCLHGESLETPLEPLGAVLEPIHESQGQWWPSARGCAPETEDEGHIYGDCAHPRLTCSSTPREVRDSCMVPEVPPQENQDTGYRGLSEIYTGEESDSEMEIPPLESSSESEMEIPPLVSSSASLSGLNIEGWNPYTYAGDNFGPEKKEVTLERLLGSVNKSRIPVEV